MTKLTRFVLGLMLVLAVIPIAFVLGMYIAGHCCVPPGSGLAGGAIVVGYGLIAAVIVGLSAAGLAFFLPARWLVGASLGLGLAGGVCAFMLLKVYLQAQAEMAAHLQQAHANMNKFRVSLVATPAAPKQAFQRAGFDWAQRNYSVSTSEKTCQAELGGEQAANMLGALREVEGVIYADPYPCAGTLGAVQYELDMFIAEAKPPDSRVKLAITAACLQRHPGIWAPFAVAQTIVQAPDFARTCI